MENFVNDVIPNKAYFEHTYEGDDDMPAHLKSSLFGSSITIPYYKWRVKYGNMARNLFG